MFLDAEKECKTNPAGNGYSGTKSKTVFNHSCVSWTEVENDELSAALAVDDVAKAKNYCRKLAGSKRNSPSCVVKQLEEVEENCEISFCGKLDCISTSLKEGFADVIFQVCD